MAEQNGDELSKIDTTMLQGAFAQLAAVVLTNVRACGKSAFCACKIMIVLLHHSVWHPSLGRHGHQKHLTSALSGPCVDIAGLIPTIPLL